MKRTASTRGGCPESLCRLNLFMLYINYFKKLLEIMDEISHKQGRTTRHGPAASYSPGGA
jgi:hypothetical protein